MNVKKPKKLRSGMRYGRGPWRGANVEIEVENNFIIKATLKDRRGRVLSVWTGTERVP